MLSLSQHLRIIVCHTLRSATGEPQPERCELDNDNGNDVIELVRIALEEVDGLAS